MKKLTVSMASIVVFLLIGCGSGGSNTTALNNVESTESIYSNGEGDEEIKEILLGDLLGQSPVTDSNESDTNTTVTAMTIIDENLFLIRPVGYLLDGSNLPICFNTEETILDYNDARTFTCEWFCGIYEGDGPIRVKLTFLKKTDVWELDDEDLATGSARCHN
ncbi:MAG: hypothetical protein Q9M36_15020 [Sulfurovum sp.]|nr:hypothetical protein [Sulfurovum sp.]